MLLILEINSNIDLGKNIFARKQRLSFIIIPVRFPIAVGTYREVLWRKLMNKMDLLGETNNEKITLFIRVNYKS